MTSIDAMSSSPSTRAAVTEAQADLDLAVRLNPNSIKKMIHDAENETDAKMKRGLFREANQRQTERKKLARLSVVSSEHYDLFDHYPKPDDELARLRALPDGTAAENYERTWAVAVGPSDGAMTVAKDPSTPVELLYGLSRNRDSEVRSGVARNPSTPPEVLTILASDKVYFVRSIVAKNANTATADHRALATDSDERVRQSLAGNASSHPDTLDRLARDKHDGTRIAIMFNANTSLSTLAYLKDDTNAAISRGATSEISERFTRVDYLKQLGYDAKDYEDVPDEWLIRNI